MKPLYNFIIHTDERYNNVVSVDGKDLIVNTDISVDDYRYTNRIGTVRYVPTNGTTRIRVGDNVIVHHNVFRQYYDQKGKLTDSSNYLNDNEFAVFPDQIFGYYRDESWHAVEGYCFVSPIKSEDNWETSAELPLRGIMRYTPEGLEHLKGHLVGFTPESEYEFNIEGEKLYRILSNQITIDYGLQKTKRQNNQELTTSA